VGHELPPGTTRRAAAEDFEIIENQLQGYRERMALWYERLWDLQGLWLDPEGRMIRHGVRKRA
jgi:hypothetical protein